MHLWLQAARDEAALKLAAATTALERKAVTIQSLQDELTAVKEEAARKEQEMVDAQNTQAELMGMFAAAQAKLAKK
jgi:Fic family protein